MRIKALVFAALPIIVSLDLGCSPIQIKPLQPGAKYATIQRHVPAKEIAIMSFAAPQLIRGIIIIFETCLFGDVETGVRKVDQTAIGWWDGLWVNSYQVTPGSHAVAVEAVGLKAPENVSLSCQAGHTYEVHAYNPYKGPVILWVLDRESDKVVYIK